MSRIAERFASLSSRKRKALITYIVAGDPNLEMTVSLMHEMVRNGADLLELGVPFSDPMAEGPIIQASHERSLANSTRLQEVFDIVSRFRTGDIDTPVILMGYANPVERMGYENFAYRASEVGVDGLLSVDIPLEEIEGLKSVLTRSGLDNILLVAPTSPDLRIHKIAEKATGFLYSVSLKGVTGGEDLNLAQVKNQIASIRHVSTLPIVVGFGIKHKDMAKKISAFCDGVVVGSAIVERIANSSACPLEITNSVARFITDLRSGLDETA